MRVLEQQVLAGVGAGRNAQRISRPILWLVTPASLLSCIILYLDFSPAWNLARLIFLGVMALVCACLIFSLVDQRRFWWAPRIIATLIGVGFLLSVYLAARLPFPGHGERVPPLLMSTLGFLVLGVPAFCFLLWGHTGGKAARRDAAHVTLMDRWTSRLVVLIYYAVAMALCFYVIHQIYLDIAPGQI